MESFSKNHLNDNHCFLCGELLNKKTKSDEHVIPMWLQQKHSIRDNKLTLLNGTLIPYRQLKIPCCKSCNNVPLSKIEKQVAEIVGGKFRKLSQPEEYLLFQWSSKILYGLLHKEMMLLDNRSNKSKDSIVPKKFLEDLTTFHHFMTSIMRPFEFINFTPYSIFVVETLKQEERTHNFDFFDNVLLGHHEQITLALGLAVRTDHYGIICIFQDNGYQKKYFQKVFESFDGIPLHPIQFMELACKTFYKHSLLTFSPKYCSSSTEEPWSKVLVMQANFPQGHVWKNFDQYAYAQVLYQHAQQHGCEVPQPSSMITEAGCLTFLYDKDGNPKKVEAKKVKNL